MSRPVVTTSGAPQFVELGPGSIVDDHGKIVGTGAVAALAADPSDARVIFAASASGGVWRTRFATTDDGAPPWDPLTDFQPSTAMGCISFVSGASDTRTLYAGTGCFASFCPTGTAVGLYRTTDGGNTWHVVGAHSLNGLPVRDVVATVGTSGDTVVVATLNGTDDTGQSVAGGVFFSTDSGTSFTTRSDGATGHLPVGQGWALVIHPDRPGVVYAAIDGSSSGVYRSDDSGDTWVAAATGFVTSDLGAVGRIRLTIGRDGTGSAVLYAGIMVGSKIVRLLYCNPTPGSETWSTLDLPPNDLSPGGQGKFAMAADPRHPSLFVAGDTGGVWRCDASRRASPRWEKVSDRAELAGANVPTGGFPHVDFLDFVFDAEGNLLAACDGGVYRFTNPNGLRGLPAPKWVHLGAEMRANEVIGVSYDTLHGLATIGSSDNGIAYSPHSGDRHWKTAGWGDGSFEAIDNGHSGFSYWYSLIMENNGGMKSLMRMTLDGSDHPPVEAPLLAAPSTPSVAYSGFPDAEVGLDHFMALNNVAGSRLLFAAVSLYETVDGGATVTPIFTYPSGQPGDRVSIAYGSRQDGVDRPDVVYTAFGSNVWVRPPESQTFSQLTAYSGGSIEYVSVDLHDWRIVYVIENTKVWRSDNAGTTWTECTGDLSSIVPAAQGGGQLFRVLSFRRDGTSSSEAVLVGALGGIYRSINASDGAAARWTRFGANLPRAIGQDLKYYPDAIRSGAHRGDVVVVGTQGRGVWLLTQASRHLTSPAVLRVQCSTATELVRLVRNPDTPDLLEVYDTLPPGPGSIAVPLASLPLRAIQRIVVDCPGGQNTLIIDSTNGPIDPPDGILFEAHGGLNNELRLAGHAGRERRHRLGVDVVAGRMRVEYRGVSRVTDTMTGLRAEVEPVKAASLSVRTAGPQDGALTLMVHGPSAASTWLQLANVDEVAINAASGVRRIDLDGFAVRPTALRQLELGRGARPTDIRIASTPAGVSTEIRGSGGANTVTVGTTTGTGGDVSAVHGPIRIIDSRPGTTLTVSHAASQTESDFALTGTGLHELAPAPILWQSNSLVQLDVAWNHGTCTVQGTPPAPTALRGAQHVNKLRIQSTTGEVDYTIGPGVDYVELGHDTGSGSTLAGILGPVTVRTPTPTTGAPTGNVNITIDDSGDSQPRDVVIDDGSVRGLTASPIVLDVAVNLFLNGLTVKGGNQRVFYSLVDTPPLFTVELHGQGHDIVNVYRTRHNLRVDGAAAITVGSDQEGVAHIAGAVRIVGGPTGLTVNDSGSHQPRSVRLDRTTISGLAATPIDYSGGTLSSLLVRLGYAANTVDIEDTTLGPTDLALGPSTDGVHVRGTSGSLRITGRPPSHAQVSIGTQPSEPRKSATDGVRGSLRLDHCDTVDVLIADGLGTASRHVKLSLDEIDGLAPAAITFDALQSLAIWLSAVGNQLSVESTPPPGMTTVTTGGNDHVVVLPSASQPCDLFVEAQRAGQSDVLRVEPRDPPVHLTNVPPTGSAPGIITVSYTDGSQSLIRYRHITRVQEP